ncbi:MAG: hypothetical protein EOP82_21645 [Variovorax sp.]|nr:MAG: hypothetical protein EOP82_21645 [Variovorax sp.]
MTTTHDEFIQTHAIDGKLTPLQAAQLLELPMGDTGITPDDGSKPIASLAEASGSAGVPADDGNNNTGALPNSEPGPGNTVILAKDGKHTIGYEKLVEAREGEKHWKAQFDATQQQLAALTQQADQRVAAGQAPTQVDNQAAAAQAAISQGVDPEIFGDFSEEALAKGIATLVDLRVAAAVAASVDKALAPQREQQATDATTAHYQAIYEKHADADSIAESKELADWIEAQPSFVRDGYRTVLGKGQTAQIIELFDAFKQASGWTSAAAGTTSSEAVKAAAKAAIANLRPAVPASLTDIPGGRPTGLTQFEAMGQMSGPELAAAMENMTPAQIEAYMAQLG